MGRTAMVMVYVLLGAAVLLGLWAALTFNMLVRARNRAIEAWSGVDVQLRRRHDLVPSLVEVVSGYASHERQVMEAVAEARDAASTAGKGAYRRRSEADLSLALGQVRWSAERYPELAASESFLRLQAQIAEVENEIRAARGIYNSNVEIFNTLIQSFPSSLIARTAGFSPQRFFDLAPAERVPVRPLSVAA